MSITVSKTDYLIYRDCPKNAWLKKNKPEIYYKSELSSFEKLIIETGNEVEKVARMLFPTGVLIQGHDDESVEETQKRLGEGEETLFQPIFRKENFLAAVDVLKFDKDTNEYAVYEIKATSETDKKTHYYDLAFQSNLLGMCGLNVTKMHIIHLNPEYVRDGEIEITKLFVVDDVTEDIKGILEEIAVEMEEAYKYLSNANEPASPCACVYKGRSKHCSTFDYSNPGVPKYGVHDIARIGASKAKLRELIDANIFHFHEIHEGFTFSETQQNQIDAYSLDRVMIDRENIREELNALNFPLYFLDYETFPSAIPLYDGYSPYQQIPFQYSLHVLRTPDGKLEHCEFLYTEQGDPSKALADALQNDIGGVGNVIVWNKGFERGRNEEVARRIPEARAFMDSVNSRLYDLMDVFKKQFYVHKNFKGSTSIKKILPVLAPDLSYKTLGIQEGGTAAESWYKMVGEGLSQEEKNKIATDLKLYCGLDSFAMYVIWKVLDEM